MDSQSPTTNAIGQVESPCNRVCVLNSSDVCIGCGRSLAEIGAWGQAGRELRLEICRSARKRKLAMGDLY